MSYLSSRQRSLFSILVLITIFATLTAATCSSSVQVGNPAMPRGFTDASLPDIDLNGYIYVAQDDSISIAVKGFGHTKPGDSVPELVSINHLLAWVGPSVNDFGSIIQFTLESSAALVYRLLGQMSEEEPIWHMIDGPEIRLVRSPASWATEARQALGSGLMAPLEQNNPGMWEMMQLLPENPPVRPVAAGFVRNAPNLIQPFASKIGIHDQGISSALGSLYLDDIVFAVYSDQPIILPETASREHLQQLDAGVIAVAQSGYPGFAISFLFGTFAGRSGLKKVDISGDQVYHRTLDYLHMYVQHIGNMFFFTVSGSRDKAEALMASVLDGTQQKGAPRR